MLGTSREALRGCMERSVAGCLAPVPTLARGIVRFQESVRRSGGPDFRLHQHRVLDRLGVVPRARASLSEAQATVETARGLVARTHVEERPPSGPAGGEAEADAEE